MSPPLFFFLIPSWLVDHSLSVGGRISNASGALVYTITSLRTGDSTNHENGTGEMLTILTGLPLAVVYGLVRENTLSLIAQAVP